MKYAIGVDVGGTKIESVLINNKGRVLKKHILETQISKGKQVVLDNIEAAIISVLDKKVLGVGIGIAAVVNKEGVISPPSKMPFLHDFNIKHYFEKKLDLSVVIENDANCFILAEHSFGAAKGKKNAVGIILGTGVGAGIIINNHIYEGADFVAGEAGFMLLDIHRKDRTTYSFPGSFENLCSGPAITHYYYKYGGKIKDANPKIIFSSKEAAAKKVVKETITYLGIGLANISTILNPEAFVLGGGVSKLSFYSMIRKEFKKHSLKQLHKTKILKHKISDSSGSIGAATLLLK
ncbi:ROK family protein [Candidatus Woesearchaeota archaeon]|nr:ROK family protein [Candidatus Woesearchaeota archaeon]